MNPCIPHQKEEIAPCTPAINYCLKSEVSITLHCQLCSTHYTALRIKNCSKSTSAIKVATMKNIDNFHYGWKSSHATAKLTLFAVSKDGWDRRTLVSPRRIHCTYYGMPKGNSWAKAVKNQARSLSCYRVTLI